MARLPILAPGRIGWPVLLLLVTAASASAQAQKVAIDQMDVRPSTRTIELMLTARPTPELAAVLQATPIARGWLVQSVETATGAVHGLDVEAVDIAPVLAGVTLRLAPVDPSWLDTATHVVSVTFLRSASLTRAVSAPTAATPGGVAPDKFVAAPTAQAADVYFAGKFTATDHAKPKYAFEARLRNDWELPGHRGHLGYLAEIAADEATNADPDRINAGVTYRRILDPRARGLILQVQPLAGEFGRKSPRTTTILAIVQVEHVLVPTTGTPKSKARWAVVVLGGVELGANTANAIDKEDGSGAVARARVAANPFVVLKPPRIFKSLKGSAFWDVRMLAQDEIDPGELDARQQPTLTRRTRQHLKLDLDLGLNDFVSLTVQHRWGYLPPTYKKVNATVSLSLTYKGMWAK